MKLLHTTILTAAIIGAVSVAGFADSHAEEPEAITVRHGMMQIIASNAGVVGGMARGTAEYDAAAAQEAADNLAAVGMITTTLLFPEGSSSDDFESSRALPKIWEDRAGYDAAWAKFGEAAVALQAVASDGLDPLKAAMGEVGKTCGACHDAYRKPNS